MEIMNILLDPISTKKTARNKLGLQPAKFYFLLIGNLQRNKGINVFIQALSKLELGNDVKFLIVGRPESLEFENSLRLLIEETNVKNLIFKPKFIPQEELSLYYRSADIIVLPYEEITESGVLRFAQTLSIPVIASNLPEFESSIEDGKSGFIFQKNDPKSLKGKIICAYEKSSDLESIGKEFNKGKVSWDNIAEITVDLYNIVQRQS